MNMETKKSLIETQKGTNRRFKFLNIYIDNVTMEEAVEYVDYLVKKGTNTYIVTPNLDHIVLLDKDEEFKTIYDNADMILADGKPLLWIANKRKTPIREKVSGSDFFPKVCEMAAIKGYTIFILGAAEGVAELAAKKLAEQYRGLKVAGTYSPTYGFENNTNELNEIKTRIVEAHPDILAVSLGSPKGEKFIYEHLKEYNVPVSMSIGATIDFIAGNVKRCPKWMSNVGLEWLYRTIKEPKRMIKRYWNDAVNIIPILRKYK